MSILLTAFQNFPGPVRVLFPGLSSPGKCHNKIPGLFRFSRTRTNPVYYYINLRYLSTVTVRQAHYYHLFPLLQLRDEEHVGEFVLFVQRFPSISQFIISNHNTFSRKMHWTAWPFLSVVGFSAFPVRVNVQNMKSAVFIVKSELLIILFQNGRLGQW